MAPADAWQRDQLYRVLDEVVSSEAARRAAADSSAGSTSSEARCPVSERLQGRPTRANFRTGDLTVCTLVPMRSVPHRVVGLLGLDDGVFPRHTERDGDDLLSSDPHVGDRDARSEDRQLLLDAVLAATDHLVITFSGRDERTNRERPPAVPIAELLDVVDRTVRMAVGADPARQCGVGAAPVAVVRPPQLHGRARPDGTQELRSGQPRRGRRRCRAPRRARRPFLTGCLPPMGGEVVQLDSLIRFVEHPVKSFLRERLGWYAGTASDEINDALPIELDPLEKWEVGDRLLTARLAGADLRRRRWPPSWPEASFRLAASSTPWWETWRPPSRRWWTRSAAARAPTEPDRSMSTCGLPDGRLLIGTVPGVRDGIIVRCVYSRLAPKHRLAAWVRFLALSAAWPDRAVASVLLGRGRKPAGGRQLIRTSVLPPSAPRDRPWRRLGGRAGRPERPRRPLRPGHARAAARSTATPRPPGRRPAGTAATRWRRRPAPGSRAYEFPREDAEPEHLMVLGGELAFERCCW